MTTKRFNLDTLPLCGAKTRSGGTCKRKGNKHNGRCKLHGGKSTGAKTAKGKKASSLNARQSVPDWFWTPFKMQWLDNPLFDEATLCCHKLIRHQQDSSAINQLVAKHQVALEVMKYAILQIHGTQMFITIQGALDHYYQDTNSSHIGFHVYYPLISSPQYYRHQSKAQTTYADQWLHKKDFVGREMRKLEKRLKRISE
ncbi:HGGxSTG domain-containing protein [Vibrio sp. PID23_8]|uniref:HGGxSTG domain-containing protein n=1 Tax=Vibrio sp. PID23_8 TaxID=1583767 RepID=UPI000E68233E|nr:HGGxSTG domain-containing protein [Vibrio sp. PID23_8]RIZ50763.1 hypothetical protein AK966_18015 [Vibrio sp. PID23_8]